MPKLHRGKKEKKKPLLLRVCFVFPARKEWRMWEERGKGLLALVLRNPHPEHLAAHMESS